MHIYIDYKTEFISGVIANQLGPLPSVAHSPDPSYYNDGKLLHINSGYFIICVIYRTKYLGLDQNCYP